MQDIVYKTQDLRRLDWNDNSRSSLGTPGCFLKTYEHEGAKRIYYKMSNYDSYRGVFGHESVNELIVSRVLDVLGIEHVRYRLVHSLVEVDHKEFETWLCTSRNFKKSGDGVERILSQEHIEKIWEMLYGRWKRYEEIQYQK